MIGRKQIREFMTCRDIKELQWPEPEVRESLAMVAIRTENWDLECHSSSDGNDGQELLSVNHRGIEALLSDTPARGYLTTRSWRINYGANNSLGFEENQWKIPFIAFLVFACS